jgi:hypothetical protein
MKLHPVAALPVLALAGAFASPHADAQAQPRGWEFGAVVDAAVSSRELALGFREQGLGLGHSDLFARGPLGRHLSAQATLVAHTSDGKLEGGFEEAWVQTRTLPAGWSARLGRFSSQIGYLNEQHPHADDFVERPLLHRAFLGTHWFDDGLRVNWTAPTPFYLNLGAEVFRGRQLVRDAVSARSPGASTLSAKVGADLSPSHSWQAGAAYMLNRRKPALEAESEAEGHEVGAGHDHAHGARFSGRNLWLLDAVWKWAPGGNNRQNQVRLVGEYARINRVHGDIPASGSHQAASLGAVWRFAQDWEAGLRSERLRALAAHEGHFDPVRLREHALMVAWKPSHAQALRLQFTTQRNALNVEDAARRAVQLQYVLSFGAHGAHSF